MQVRFEAERAREQSQRLLAAAEGRCASLQARLDDTLADNRGLRHKVPSVHTTARCPLKTRFPPEMIVVAHDNLCH